MQSVRAPNQLMVMKDLLLILVVFAKPMYYIDKKIGDPLDINACWKHPFMKSLRNYNNVPKECKKCSFLEKCKGGDRYSAYFFNGSYKAKDPLMDLSKVENYIW